MKKLLYFLLCLMVSLSVVVFTSCENFMDGSDVQSHFEELIDIANAKSYTIIVSQDEAMGSFLSSGDKDCKVGSTPTPSLLPRSFWAARISSSVTDVE